MYDAMSPAVINRAIGMMPGTMKVRVHYGGVTGWGQFANVPTSFGGFGAEADVVASEPSVVVASEYFPGIGLCTADGTADGVGEDIEVGDYVWYIRGIEPGESEGEARLLLTNRRNNTDG